MKKIRLLLVLLIILNVVALIYLLINPGVQNVDFEEYSKEQYDKKVKNSVINGNEVENELILDNIDIISNNYKGEIPNGYINTKIKKLVEGGLLNLCNDTKGMNATELNNYLESNKTEIANETGITDIDDFINFVQKIQIYKNENLKFEKAQIVENSYIVSEDVCDSFKVQINYDNGQTIIFNVLFSKKDHIDTPIVVIK